MIQRLPLKTLHFIFVICLLIYCIVQVMKSENYVTYPFVYNHLNDLVVIPIVATIGLHAIWMVKKNRQLRVGIIGLLSLVMLYSLYFEYYLPLSNARYTSDFWDIVCYAAGAIIFYIAQKLP
ncbi:hypothetical protein BST92_11320 [Nonlabens arenilitoris]|uniref:Magnesium citrate secondary transporter n=2 Tax=Nonlabens arenilitoris TaxID=1217969 RepID=A0A2S7UD22_9FLAO|nr:hypothetical protein BST92_11320 [Nonlabens arenilitoris]